MVSRHLPNLGPALCAKSRPVRQVLAAEHIEGMGVSDNDAAKAKAGWGRVGAVLLWQ